MQAIRNKLKTQKGASITFALLLFLVCAVISSVVIVAATTAAGRMSQLPQMDQRYYAVTSAANLLKSEIDGKEIVVSKHEGDYTAYYKDKPEEIYPTAKDNTILTDASIQYVKKKDGVEEAVLIVGPDRSFTLKDKNGTDKEFLTCKIDEMVQMNGLLYFEIRNSTDPAYILQIVFSPNIKDFATGNQTRLAWKFHSMKKIRSLADTMTGT